MKGARFFESVRVPSASPYPLAVFRVPLSARFSNRSASPYPLSYDAKLLRVALVGVGKVAKALEQAAHIVPTGLFRNRSGAVKNAISKSKEILERAGIGLNEAVNGFFATAGHNGTHTDKFFLKLFNTLVKAEKDGKVRQVLQKISNKKGII